MENTQPIVSKYSNGEVTLPINIYNQMLMKIALYERAISLRKSWDGSQIELEINPVVIEDQLVEMFNKSDLPMFYSLNKASDIYKPSAIAGSLKPGYKIVDGKVEAVLDADE